MIRVRWLPLLGAFLLLPVAAATPSGQILDLSNLPATTRRFFLQEKIIESAADWGGLQFAGNASYGAAAGVRLADVDEKLAIVTWGTNGEEVRELGDPETRVKLFYTAEGPLLVTSNFQSAAAGAPLGRVEFAYLTSKGGYERTVFHSVPGTGAINWDADVDPAGTIHLVYHDVSGVTFGALRYGTFESGEYQEELVGVTQRDVAIPALVLREAGPTVLLQDDFEYILYGKTGQDWSSQTILSQPSRRFVFVADKEGSLALIFAYASGLCEGMGVYVAQEASNWKPTKVATPGCSPGDGAVKTVLLDRSLRAAAGNDGSFFVAFGFDEVDGEQANRTYVVLEVNGASEIYGVLPRTDQFSLVAEVGEPALLVHKNRTLALGWLRPQVPSAAPTADAGQSPPVGIALILVGLVVVASLSRRIQPDRR